MKKLKDMKKLRIMMTTLALTIPSAWCGEPVQPEQIPSFVEQDYLTGDWGGARTQMEENGVTFFLNYTGEGWGVVDGGISTGSRYVGLADFGFEIDMEKAVGWKGASFFINAYELHGEGVSEDLLGEIATVSNIDGNNTIRLFEAWYQQKFADGAVSLRLGQLAADSEFAISEVSGLFINGTFGWPLINSENASTPEFEIAALGVRVMVRPTENWYIAAAAYDGVPSSEDNDGNILNENGVRYRFAEEEGAFIIAETGYNWTIGGGNTSYGGKGKKQIVEEDEGLPGFIKIGGWVHTGEFENPVTGELVDGNWAIYAVADQMVYRERGDQGLSAFLRLGYSDTDDTSGVEFYTDFGLSYLGLFPGRDEDVAGIAFGYGELSAADAEAAALAGDPIPDETAVLELTYLFQITPFFFIQPDVQFHFNPAGDGTVEDAVVVGSRFSLDF